MHPEHRYRQCPVRQYQFAKGHSSRIIPKELTIDPFDGVKSGHSGRRGAQRDAVHRASGATQQMGGFGPKIRMAFGCSTKAINLIVSKGAEQLYGFLEPMLFYRPVFRDHRTSLCSTCGLPDHGVKHASPANAKKPVKWVNNYFLWY